MSKMILVFFCFCWWFEDFGVCYLLCVFCWLEFAYVAEVPRSSVFVYSWHIYDVVFCFEIIWLLDIDCHYGSMNLWFLILLNMCHKMKSMHAGVAENGEWFYMADRFVCMQRCNKCAPAALVWAVWFCLVLFVD